MRTVVMQVEDCSLSVLVGYRPGTGEPTSAILSRVANQPKSRVLDALKEVMSAYAVAPITVAQNGQALVPTKVEAKVGVEPGGARPIVVVLVTYALPNRGAVEVTSKDPRTTRISWQDRSASDGHGGHGRVDLATAPAQDHYHDGVASFLLNVGASTCAAP